MKLSSPLVVVLSSIGVGPIWIAAEPCGNGYGAYDMVACNLCAETGENKEGFSGVCCNSIYRHSLGRDDDNIADANDLDLCRDINKDGCVVYQGEDQGDCYPGLFCNAAKTCQLQEDNPNAHAASSLVTWSSLTGNTTKDGHSVVLVVVGLIVAAMIAMKVVQHRHRVFLHRNQ